MCSICSLEAATAAGVAAAAAATATAHSHKLNAKLFEFLYGLVTLWWLALSARFCCCFCQMNFAAAAHTKLLGAAWGQEDTDLDTVIRICPFRVFGNFSTLLNYRVSCLHSSWASVAPRCVAFVLAA